MDYYTDGKLNGVGQSGQEHGQQTQNFARPGDQPFGHEQFGLDSLGKNSDNMLVANAMLAHPHANRG
jgi:hypothetical protein